MTTPTRHQGNHEFPGTVSLTGVANLPDDAVENKHIKLDAANPIGAEKQEGNHFHAMASPIGTDVTDLDEVRHIFDAAATIEQVAVVAETAPTGGDKETAVDVQIHDGTSWVSILSGGAADVDDTWSDGTAQDLTLDGTPTAVAGDLLRIKRTNAGTTGSHAQGLAIVVKWKENP